MNPQGKPIAERKAAPPSPHASHAPELSQKEKLFALLCGLWIGLSFLKFGNPIIFDRMIDPPKDWAEFVVTSWPISWGYVLLALVVIVALPLLKRPFQKPSWPMALLAFWLFWQILSSAQSVDPRLSNPTIIHFVTCGVALLLGWWVLPRLRSDPWFWIPLTAGFCYVLYRGFEQHAGGLEATRRAFFEQPGWQLQPKEYLLKMQSNRIFATLIYPNTFAGLILLMLPSVLWQAWQLTDRWPRILRGVFVGLIGYLGLACFYWTGSKGGWLIALIVAGIFALQTNISRKLKTTLITAGLILGLAAFFLRFSAYFEKGATSVGARFVYWKAAAQIVKMHPILGSGPGTFSVLFKQLKPPEAEMAKLVHNDYLEQFSDAGIPAGLAFVAAISALLVISKRAHSKTTGLDSLLWLGLLAWALQGFIEFGLYIPALAWPAFLFLGALYGAARSLPKPKD